jgi:hypothetical protein
MPDRARRRRSARTHEQAADLHERAAELHDASVKLHTEHAAETVGDPQSVKRAVDIVERERLRAAKERRLAAEHRSHARDDGADS